jgi:hypothetical protein
LSAIMKFLLSKKQARYAGRLRTAPERQAPSPREV